MYVDFLVDGSLGPLDERRMFHPFVPYAYPLVASSGGREVGDDEDFSVLPIIIVNCRSPEMKMVRSAFGL